MTCIIVADQQDLHADLVIQRLNEFKLDLIRIDPYLGDIDFHFDSEYLDEFLLNGEKVRFKNVTGVYCRMALESLSIDSNNPVTKYSFSEYIGALNGFLLRIPQVKWMNFPWNESRADGKIYSLCVALSFGIKIPKFIISNHPSKINKAALGDKNPVIKPITDFGIAFQDNKYTDNPRSYNYSAPFTSELNWTELEARNEIVEDVPFLIQKKIDAIKEIRCVYVDGNVYASSSDYNRNSYDSRLVARTNEVAHQIDFELISKIHALMNNLGLNFSTMDFLLDQVGSYWLVDINPSGNWLWQELNMGIPISTAISRFLTK